METPIPFVDLSHQHQPLEMALRQVFQQVAHQGDFILGAAVQRFEAAFAQFCGAAHGVGVACGTDALALGLRACGIGPGDEVLVPTHTFVATVLGVQATGATPVLVDCDPATGLMDLEAAAATVGDRTRAIVPVHLYGQMVSPQGVLALAQRHGLLIFEDAAQAHGAEREGYRAGSLGKAAAFSFYPSKNLGAMGDGGMVVTSDPAIAEKVRILRNYGAPRKYFHTEPGQNSRLDTLQAGILEVKLPHLPDWNRQRWEAAQAYDRGFATLGEGFWVQPLANPSGEGHVYHLYVVALHPEAQSQSWGGAAGVEMAGGRSTGSNTAGHLRDRLLAFLEQHHIQAGIHYPICCHLQPIFESLGYRCGDFPQAESLGDRILSLPLYPGITPAQVQRVLDTLAQPWHL